MGKNIEDVLNFREDISPFLVHLTRRTDTKSARMVLEDIILSNGLRQSGKEISDVKWGCRSLQWDEQKKKNLFSSVCFTETPLNEIHCLLDINKRQVELEPYGLVFLKSRLIRKNVSPVFYLNNYGRSMDETIRTLGEIVASDTYSTSLHKLFPLFSSIGYKYELPSSGPDKAIIDFSWEREWRLPYCYGDFSLDYDNDVFIGLCPHEEIDYFEGFVAENELKSVPFIDPRRNAKWYAEKITERCKRFELSYSVL